MYQKFTKIPIGMMFKDIQDYIFANTFKHKQK